MFAVVTLAFGLLTACGNSTPPAGPSDQAGIEVGAPAPAFEFQSSEGRAVSSADLLGRKPLLLYFSMGPG